jgi:NAD(P)-dependent dehydrogenase (short-subunit alcohol dehydrogenase family)
MAIQKQDFDRFMGQVRTKLAGASDAGIKAELYEVLDEFCDDSTAWQEQLSVNVLPPTATSNNLIYDLVPQQGGTIIRLVAVFDPNQIPVPAFLPTGANSDLEVGQLSLVNPVNTAQVMTVLVAKTVLLPTQRDQIPVFDQTLFRRYLRYIIDGTLGKMMGHQSKSYSNASGSTYHLQKFQDGKAMARVQSARQNTYGAQAWSYPQQFRSHGQRGGVSTADPTRF